MKKILSLATILLATMGLHAQTHIRVWQNDESERMKIANVGDMVFSGETVTIKGSTYNVNDIDSIVIVPEITVAFSENDATVNVPEAIANDITVTTDGANVTITNTNVSNEVELILSGTSSDGSFTYDGNLKCTIELNGLNLTSKDGCPMNIQCGKRIALILDDGTVNSLTDGSSNPQKACLYSKGHIEMEGGGTLNVTGNKNHAIATKEYLQLKKSMGTLNIVKAMNDAIHVEQYFQMNGGIVNIDANTVGDGVQVNILTLDDDVTPNPDKENNGEVIIKGGTLNIDVNNEDSKGIKSDGNIYISGGTFNINANGNGSRGIQTDGSMVISEDDNTTNITIAANGAQCTAKEDADDPHRCMGMKIDGDLTINAGTVTVTNTGNKSRGIKVTGTYTKNGGTVTASITH